MLLKLYENILHFYEYILTPNKPCLNQSYFYTEQKATFFKYLLYSFPIYIEKMHDKNNGTKPLL